MKTKNYRNPVGTGNLTGLLLISPFIVGFAVFTLYPFVCSFILGMTDYAQIHRANIIGAENYVRMISDRNFLKAFGLTFRYEAILVPLKLIVSLSVALLLNIELKGIGIYRTVFYIPSILGSNLAIVIMWQLLFTSGGLVDQVFQKAGLSPVSWYGEPMPALFIIVLF